MSSLKRWCVGVSLVAMLLSAGQALAQDGEAGPAKPKKQPAKKAPVAKARFSSGTVLDQALASLNLEQEKAAQVADALKAWKEKAGEEKAALEQKRKDLQAQLKAADKEKKKELAKQLADLKGPSDVEQYNSAKAALKDLLSEEQLAKVDQAAQQAAAETAVKMVTGTVASWTKKGVELTDEQKAAVEAQTAKVKDEAAKLPAGARNQAMSVAMKHVNEIRATLTEEQKAKIAPPRKEGGQPNKPAKPQGQAPAPVAPEGEM